MSNKARLWSMGILGLWYLRPSQLDVYDMVVRKKDAFAECARRFGKTTTVLCYVFEELRKNPGWVALWCEPLKNQAREIVMPEINKIFAQLPEHERPVYSSTDSFYRLPNGSIFKLRGVNEDKGESARGSFANLIVCDEFGSWRDAHYVVNEALRPQLLTTQGKFIFMGTPPRDLAHLYYSFKEDAIREQRFVQKLIYDNESLTPEQIEEACQAVGGPDSPAWKREYLCEAVSDPDRLVIPEYRPELHMVSDDYERPNFFTAYCGLDLGFNDKTFIAFGYFDFLKQELVIEDELCVSGKNSKEIVDAAKSIEHTLWGNGVKPDRYSDNDLQQLYDMHSLYGYSCTPTAKEDKIGAINLLRLRFQSGKIKIKSRCTNLLYQLKVGLWKENRSDFEKNKETGHLDGIMALVYMNRNINERLNPVPHMHGFSHETMHINQDLAQSNEIEIAHALSGLGGFK